MDIASKAIKLRRPPFQALSSDTHKTKKPVSCDTSFSATFPTKESGRGIDPRSDKLPVGIDRLPVSLSIR
jgi:hypothetical protein